MPWWWHGGNGEPADPPPDPPPKGNNPPGPAAPSSDATILSAENGVVIPIVYGTMRVPGNLVERYAYTFAATSVPARQPSTLYNVLGAIVGNFGNLYIVKVTGTTGSGSGPSGTGSGQVDGGVTFDYVKMGYRHMVAIGYCEGLIYGVGKAWQDKNVFSIYTLIPNDGFLTLALGTASGGRPGSGGAMGLQAWFPPQTDVYGNTVVFYASLNTGSDADLPKTDLEIKGVFADATHVDANPADMAVDLLTHARRGSQWPSTMVDAVSTGAGAASWKTYCTATGFVFSWLIDSVQSGKQLLAMLLAASNTDAVWTNRADGVGGMLKFVPRGTDSITANGVTFTPNLTPAYALGQDDYQSTIDIDVIAPTDTYNSFPIEYTDRASDYKSITVDDPCMDDVDLRGLARANTTKIPLVMAPAAAVQLSRIKAQRSLNVANTYRAKLNYRFLLLEPTDLVTITEPDLGLLAVPARVTVFEEDQATGEITITCEDFPAAVHAAAFYTPQANDGFKPTVSTALGVLSVLPGQAPTTVVPDASSTRGGAVGNLYPNPISETNPPDGVDTTTAEWAGRTNAVAAVTGTWTRTPGLGASLAINYDVTAAPGETYYFEAQVKATAAAANKGGFLKIEAFDATGASVGSAASTENDTTSFAKLTIGFLMPANTVRARFSLKNGTDAAAQAYFDLIYARKAINAGLIEPGTVLSSHISGGQNNTLNLWPNPTSEIPPPSSYTTPGDGSDPEFDFRYAAGSPYAGLYVRRLLGGAVRSLVLWVPCSPGEQFSLDCQAKFITGTNGTDYLYVEALYYAADKTTATGSGNGTAVAANVTTWTQISTGHANAAGSNTAYVRLYFELSTIAHAACGGSVEAWVDAIIARRMVQTADIADGAVTAAKVSAQEAWNAPSFATGWANLGSPNLAVGYMKDHLGVVHLRGTAKTSAGAAATVFTLPSGYRPSATARFEILALDGATVIETAGHASVTSAGVVSVTGFSLSAGGPANASLDGITFDTR